jgi:vacuolar-type H+-ATPase subunit I/STV1
MAKKANQKNSAEIVAVDKMQVEIETAEQLYSDGMPYEIERIENEIRFYQEQAGTSLLEMGKRFIRIKAHEDHGRFLKVIENVSMTARSVQYAMAAAIKFSNTKSISHLGTTKMIALSVLDEDEVQVLDDGGNIAGVNIDDIDRMSIRELRAHLRAEKEKVKKEKEARKRDRDTQEKVIAQKEAKINELDQQLRYQQPPTKEQLAVAELAKLDSDYFHELTSAMAAMRKAVDILNWAQCVPGANVQMLNEWVGKYNEEMVLLNGVREEFINILDNLHPVTKGEYQAQLGDDVGVSADVPDIR